MAKQKRTTPEQQAIAEAAAVSQEHRKLKRQISTLKRLPKDFRDIIAGTNDWEAFATITGRRKEMEAWDNGPIVCLASLNEHEKMILGSQNKLVVLTELLRITEKEIEEGDVKELTPGNWYKVIEHAEARGCSWIYLPDEPTKVVSALNELFSHFGYNIRAKGRLMSEHSGKPVGVVH